MHSIKYTTGAAALVLGIALTASPSAYAADKALLDILLGNGAITQEQYDELLAKDELTAADMSGVEVSVDGGGLAVSSADGNFEIGIGGRLHADFAHHNGADSIPVAPTDGTEIRRARLELDGTFHEDWSWAASTDLADNTVSVKDFMLTYEGFDSVNLTFGHQKQPYSLALEMSSNDMPFTERSIDNELIVPYVDRAIGIRADASGARWYASAGIFGESVSPGDSGDEGWALVGRYVYAPILEEDRVLHLGFRAAQRDLPSSNPTTRIRAETTHFSSLYLVDTGTFGGVDQVTLFGPEFAYAKDRLSLSGEFNDASIDRNIGGDLSFSSWHVAATWTLGPESRVDAYRIDAGEFKGLRPAQNFSRGNGGGTWELAARYASIDLNDGSFIGGSEEAISVGANWYVNPNVRLLFDWTHVVDTDDSNATRMAADGLDIVAARVQYTF